MSSQVWEHPRYSPTPSAGRLSGQRSASRSGHPLWARQQWYRAYCDAMLQDDERRVEGAVACARAAIQNRLTEIRPGTPGTGREMRDLDDALKYLAMLLEYSFNAQHRQDQKLL